MELPVEAICFSCCWDVGHSQLVGYSQEVSSFTLRVPWCLGGGEVVHGALDEVELSEECCVGLVEGRGVFWGRTHFWRTLSSGK